MKDEIKETFCMPNIVEQFGKYINKITPEHPERARALLLASYRAYGLKLRLAPTHELPPSRQFSAQYVNKTVQTMLSHPERAALVSVLMPCELLETMSVTPMCAELYSCFINGAYAESAFAEAAEAEGIAESYCSYHKILLGSAYAGVLPAPKFIVNTSLVCDANNLTFRELADYYGIPQFYVDVPPEQSEDCVAYVANELRELKDFLVPQEKIEDYFRTLYGQKYEMDFRLYFSDVKPRMAIFVSKLSHCLFDMLARYTAGEWNVEIPLIISNHPDLQHVAERFGIPFYLFPITKETKEEQERKEMELLAKHKITFIVLARYMQVISEQMINAYPNKIINIHHSFLPAFVGAKPYHAAFQRGVKIIGATSHYVTTELDAGPIIEQDVVRITHKDAIEDLVNKGKDLEKIVLSRAVQKHIERKVLAYKNKTVIFS